MTLIGSVHTTTSVVVMIMASYSGEVAETLRFMQVWDAAAFLHILNYLCKSYRNFWLTERDFKSSITWSSDSSSEQIRKLSSIPIRVQRRCTRVLVGQFWYLTLKDFLSVLIVARLLIRFGFYAVEIVLVGSWHHDFAWNISCFMHVELL